jgi:signal transduction histidine kinase
VSIERPPSLFAGVEPLEVFVELLADLDNDTSSTDFYDRICEAICRLTTMRRAAIFMADSARRRVYVVGAHGTSFRQLMNLQPSPTLLSTPIAQRALLEDEVVVVSDGIEDQVPSEYAEMFGITTLVCTPLSAAGHAYGVICADRGGGRFELTDGERHLLWTLGKTAALVATARNATRQQERTRRLGERLELAREIHERVMQRLFGVEMQEALSDLRSALERPLAPVVQTTATTLAAEVARIAKAGSSAQDGAPGLPLVVDWPDDVVVPVDVEPLAQSVFAEALRNIAKHASPTRVQVSVSSDADTFALEVRNDGVGSGARGAGMGLRLAAFEALQHGGMVEFGTAEPGHWRVRLVVPIAEAPVAEAPVAEVGEVGE